MCACVCVCVCACVCVCVCCVYDTVYKALPGQIVVSSHRRPLDIDAQHSCSIWLNLRELQATQIIFKFKFKLFKQEITTAQIAGLKENIYMQISVYNGAVYRLHNRVVSTAVLAKRHKANIPVKSFG